MSKAAEPEPTRSSWSMETLSSAVQTLAIVLAGAWGVYTFVYEAKIAPGLAPPSVSVTSALERVGEKDGRRSPEACTCPNARRARKAPEGPFVRTRVVSGKQVFEIERP
jgi:hypothetical protein